MPRHAYIPNREMLQAQQHLNGANNATRAESGAASLNNFMNNGAAQNSANQLASHNATNATFHTELADERDQYQQNFERSLQDRAMGNKEAETRLKYASQDKMSAAMGSMGRMGGGLLGGLTTTSAQRPAVSLFGSSGRRIGGTPLSGLA
jgi:hypothetical protein